jgi:hypothetical protein
LPALLTNLTAKFLKEGFLVPPRHAAAHWAGEDQHKGALVFLIYPSMVLTIDTSCSFRSAAFRIWITLAITCPQRTIGIDTLRAQCTCGGGSGEWLGKTDVQNAASNQI